VIWGPSRVQIYNDALRAVCGTCHAQALGQDFRDSWSATFPPIVDAFERASHGAAGVVENCRMFVDRRGYLEEAFFTHSFAPLRDEDGAIGGVLQTVSETSSSILLERRLSVAQSNWRARS
jgi:hypothetical protein